MAAQRTFGRTFSGRTPAYALLALLAAIPVLAFAIGPLTSESFSLSGPAGPLLAFSAGVLSFVSPCVLPLVPIYITHISGSSVVNGRIVGSRAVTFAHGLSFVAGLSVIFIALGAGAGLLGSYVLQDNQRAFEQWAGVLLVFLGILVFPSSERRSPAASALLLLLMTVAFIFVAEVARLQGDTTRLILLGIAFAAAWLRFAGYLHLPLFSRTFQVNIGANHGVGYTRSALIGSAFALGWTPCIGPILGAILTLAGTSEGALTGTYLLVSYAAGFSVPFLISALLISDVQSVLRRIQSYAGAIEVLSGLMLIMVGILLVTGRLTGLNEFFNFAEFNNGL